MTKIADLPKIEREILAIRRLIITSMNGEVADSMINYGVKYKKNFGVDIPRLRNIATRFQESAELADKLWESRIREMMILAIYLYPLNEFNEKKAEEWISDVEQMEIIEQLCMHLLSKCDYSSEIAVRWIASPDQIRKIAGFTLATRIFESFTEEEFSKIVSLGIKNATTDNFHLYKSIGNCLGRLTRRSEKDAHFIKQHTAKFEDSIHISEKYIFQEVTNELSF